MHPDRPARARAAAMPFIMATMLIDMLAIGLIIPVLPAMVGSCWCRICPKATGGLARRFIFAPLCRQAHCCWRFGISGNTGAETQPKLGLRLRLTVAKAASPTANNARLAGSGTWCRKPRISPPGLKLEWTFT